ncbi:glycerol-3-phosphate responsive antiterminator [Mycoplasmatota bacterium WC44]
MLNDRVIPAVKSVKDLEKFLKTNYDFCILMGMHISVLKSIVERVHIVGKKCLLHIDLINGLSNDEYGAEYAIQFFGVDGLVSTKASVIRIAKKKKVISIFRIFLIDTYSLNKSIERTNELKPDFVEVLPAISHNVISTIKERINTPIVGGGLIQTKQDIDECIDHGMKAITTSNVDLW